MKEPFRLANTGRLFASLLALGLLLPAASANADWRGYDSDWRCDPKLAFLEEYGYLDYRGPSRGDMKRLNRDRWKSAYYRDPRYDPVTRALRKRCPSRYRY